MKNIKSFELGVEYLMKECFFYVKGISLSIILTGYKSGYVFLQCIIRYSSGKIYGHYCLKVPISIVRDLIKCCDNSPE